MPARLLSASWRIAPAHNVHDWSSIKLKLRDEVSHLMYERTKRSPMILPILMDV